VSLGHWHRELAASARTNRLVAFGGLCSDSLGAVAFVHDMLVQGQEGFLRLFPAWPAELDASFRSLRMRGALLVSAAYAGQAAWQGQVAGLTGGALNVSVLAENTAPVRLLSPWPAAGQSSISVVDLGSGASLGLQWSQVGGRNGGPALQWGALAGHSYVVRCGAGAQCVGA
jgi:hypothetical protein